MIDVEKELVKLETKKDSLGKQLKKLQDVAAVPTYHTKVPQDVRDKNTEKVGTDTQIGVLTPSATEVV